MIIIAWATFVCISNHHVLAYLLRAITFPPLFSIVGLKLVTNSNGQFYCRLNRRRQTWNSTRCTQPVNITPSEWKSQSNLNGLLSLQAKVTCISKHLKEKMKHVIQTIGATLNDPRDLSRHPNNVQSEHKSDISFRLNHKVQIPNNVG